LQDGVLLANAVPTLETAFLTRFWPVSPEKCRGFAGVGLFAFPDW
jgi:hypothetical protein